MTYDIVQGGSFTDGGKAANEYAVDFTYANAVFNRFHGCVYPDQLTVMNPTMGGSVQSVLEMQDSAEAYVNAYVKQTNVGVDFGYPDVVSVNFGFSQTTKEAHQFFNGSSKYASFWNGFQATAQVECTSLSAIRNGPMQYDLNQLPEKCDDDDSKSYYYSFVALYGTHLLHGGSFGGYANYTVSLAKSLVNQQDYKSVDKNMKLSVELFKGIAGISVGHSVDEIKADMSSDFQDHQHNSTYWGGSVDVLTTSNYTGKFEEWSKNVTQHIEQNAFLPYNVNLKPLAAYTVGARQQCLNTLITNYINTGRLVFPLK